MTPKGGKRPKNGKKKKSRERETLKLVGGKRLPSIKGEKGEEGGSRKEDQEKKKIKG